MSNITNEDIKQLFNKMSFKDDLEEYIKNYPLSGFMFNHSEFLKEWILINESNFDDFNEIINLIKLTENYFNTKNENNIIDVFFKSATLDKNKTLSEITLRNIDRMEKIKEDLENLTLHGTKTKLLLEIINDFISTPTNYIPRKKKKKINNVEEIRKYLNTKKINIEEINTYIKYFQTHHKNKNIK